MEEVVVGGGGGERERDAAVEREIGCSLADKTAVRNIQAEKHYIEYTVKSQQSPSHLSPTIC